MCPVGPERLWELSRLDRTLHLLRLVWCDRTRLIGPERLWELSGLDRTLSFLRPIIHTGHVRMQLSVVLMAATATSFEWDTWWSGSDRTQTRPDASGAHDLRVRSMRDQPNN